MNIHEYQAKELFRKYGIGVPDGAVAHSVEEALNASEKLGGTKFAVKAQVHAGGRGKAGGVKIVEGKKEFEDVVRKMLGMKLVTHQTGPQGITVRKVYIEKPVDIERSMYVAAVVDRSIEKVVITASRAGDVEIEQTAAKNPELIIKEPVDPSIGIQPFQGRRVASKLGLSGDAAKKAAAFIVSLYRIFDEYDCSLAEINPLVLTKDGDIVALDAKINFDDNALYRHKQLMELEEHDESTQVEADAAEHGLSYVQLDGNIGCMVNGAGLAMATMDIVSLEGGSPANFLDIGGSADAERVTRAFEIILRDKAVEVVFVNIFGGIVRCSVVAEGIIQATKNLDLKIPIVVCLKGTNQEEGRKMLHDSGLNIKAFETMADGSKAAVNLAGKPGGGA